jgi:formyl-CoA transferase
LLDIAPDSPLYVGNESRVAHRDELQEVIEQRLGGRSVAEWIKVFADHGIPAGEVKTLDRVYGSEQVREQGLVVEVSHSTLGEISLPGRPLRFGGSPLGPAAPPPVLGEHSEEIRAQFQRAQDPAGQHVG